MTITNAYGTFTINVGTRIRLLPGYLPAEFEGTQITVTNIESGYAHFFDGSQHSAISPELITEAIG